MKLTPGWNFDPGWVFFGIHVHKRRIENISLHFILNPGWKIIFALYVWLAIYISYTKVLELSFRFSPFVKKDGVWQKNVFDADFKHNNHLIVKFASSTDSFCFAFKTFESETWTRKDANGGFISKECCQGKISSLTLEVY